MNGDDEYRAGAVDAQLGIMNKRLAEIRDSLSCVVEWQRHVDARLAAGSERFKQVNKNADDIENLKSSDRKWGVASMLGAAIAGLIATLRQ